MSCIDSWASRNKTEFYKEGGGLVSWLRAWSRAKLLRCKASSQSPNPLGLTCCVPWRLNQLLAKAPSNSKFHLIVCKVLVINNMT